MTGTPAKLRDGSWGARVRGSVQRGDRITIVAKNGKSWEAVVTSVVWSGEGVTLVATESVGTRCGTVRGTVRRGGSTRSVSSRRETPRPEGPVISRGQERSGYAVGEIIVSRLAAGAVTAQEARQGVTAVMVPGTETLAAGLVRVACVVVWETSLTEDEVEDMDAWSHQHTAVVRLATGEEAAPLLAARAQQRATTAVCW